MRRAVELTDRTGEEVGVGAKSSDGEKAGKSFNTLFPRPFIHTVVNEGNRTSPISSLFSDVAILY